MRAVAAIPAIGLIAGSAIGFLVPDLPPRVGLFLLIVFATAALWAWRASWVPALGISVACAFLVGAAMLSASAWRHAWRPPR